MKLSGETYTGSGIMTLHSPGGSTLQPGSVRCALQLLFILNATDTRCPWTVSCLAPGHGQFVGTKLLYCLVYRLSTATTARLQYSTAEPWTSPLYRRPWLNALLQYIVRQTADSNSRYSHHPPDATHTNLPADVAVRYAGHTECMSHIEEATARYSCTHWYKSLDARRVEVCLRVWC